MFSTPDELIAEIGAYCSNRYRRALTADERHLIRVTIDVVEELMAEAERGLLVVGDEMARRLEARP